MTNLLKGEREFQAGGQTLRLVYSFQALAEIEARFDKPFMAFAESIDSGALPMADWPVLFWIGLRRYQPQLTEAAALDLAEQLGVPQTMELIAASFIGAFPQREAGETGAADPLPAAASPGTSRRAGRSGKASA